MKQSGVSVDAGQSMMVAVTPTLTTTTAQAKRRFEPVDRTCYFESEVKLKHFPPGEGYRYGVKFPFPLTIFQKINKSLILTGMRCPTAYLRQPCSK